jgi:transcriptional regulator with XRE-family HTH domain
MAKRPMISDRLRTAIEQSPESLRRIAAAADVAPSVLSRFVRGITDLKMSNVDRMAAYLGLDLMASKPKVKHGKHI